MARPTAEYDTTTKTARLRLPARPKPYFRTVGAGKSLGYIRRVSGPGAWIVREWTGGRYVTRTAGVADDVGRADGRDVLTFDQALRAATKPALPASKRSRLTVGDAVELYLTALAGRSLHARETRQRAEKLILPTLGGHRIDRLTKAQIEAWRSSLVRDDPEDPDARRRSQDSANRILTILKAALNHAFADEANGIDSDNAWRRVKAYRDVASARGDHFEAAQVRALIAKAASFNMAFANLCEVGYLTGARYGELATLDVRDFDEARGQLMICRGKTGARVVVLSSEGVALLKRLTNGRPPAAPMLPRVEGDRWGKSEQARPFKRAAALAGLPESASFYALRHSHISRAIESGMPLSLVAENCGTSLTMIEKNYAHVLARTRRDVVEQTAPRLRRVK